MLCKSCCVVFINKDEMEDLHYVLSRTADQHKKMAIMDKIVFLYLTFALSKVRAFLMSLTSLPLKTHANNNKTNYVHVRQ